MVWRRIGHASQTLVVLHLQAQGLGEGDEHPPRRSLVCGRFLHYLYAVTMSSVQHFYMSWRDIVLQRSSTISSPCSTAATSPVFDDTRPWNSDTDTVRLEQHDKLCLVDEVTTPPTPTQPGHPLRAAEVASPRRPTQPGHPLRAAAVSTGDGYSCHWGWSGEFCITWCCYRDWCLLASGLVG